MHPAVVAVIIVGGALFLWSGYEMASHLRGMHSEERREYESYVRRYYEKNQFSDDEENEEEDKENDEDSDSNEAKRIFKRMNMHLGFRRRAKKTSVDENFSGNELSEMEHSIYDRRQRLAREQEQLHKMELELEQHRMRLISQGNRTLGIDPQDRPVDYRQTTVSSEINGPPPLPPRSATSLASSSLSSSEATVLPGSHGSSVLSLPNTNDIWRDDLNEQATSGQATSEQTANEQTTSEQATSERRISEHGTNDPDANDQDANKLSVVEQSSNERDVSDQDTADQSNTRYTDFGGLLEHDSTQELWQSADVPNWSSNESETSWASIHPPNSNGSERSFNSIQTPSSPSRLSESSFSYVTDDDGDALPSNHIQ